jgi:signal transduction histidine kinase
MTPRRRTPTRDHDLRMHLGVILMALQMVARPPTTPLTPDQQELINIIQRAAKSMEALLDKTAAPVRKSK